MITDKQSYRSYVKEDLKAHGLSRVGVYDYWWRDCLRFQLRLRRIEYLYNTAGHNPLKHLCRFLLEVVNHRLGTRLGFTIPKNVFGPGLHIVHYGTIVVHPDARVGKNCRLLGRQCIYRSGSKNLRPCDIGRQCGCGSQRCGEQVVREQCDAWRSACPHHCRKRCKGARGL